MAVHPPLTSTLIATCLHVLPVVLLPPSSLQPQSPSNGYRGPPPRPAGTRGFQHGMSNLRLNCQHSYDGYAGAPQPPPYGGRGSPVMSHRWAPITLVVLARTVNIYGGSPSS
jgi:hypothetical protein